VIGEPQMIIRFRESYNSMSMSCESTSLKKFSGDCLKLAKQCSDTAFE